MKSLKIQNTDAKELVIQSAKPDMDHLFEIEKQVVGQEPMNHDPIDHEISMVICVR